MFGWLHRGQGHYTRHNAEKYDVTAIVGSGIGGSSCSYFLRDQLKDDIDIDIYEANEIGGRLATLEYNNEIYELGGAVVHERNKYMNMFRKKFSLFTGGGGASMEVLAIRDSSGFKFCTSRYTIITYLKAFWNYGFMSLFRLRQFLKHQLNQFDNIYKLQDEGKAFATVKELFAATDPNFLQQFKISAKDGFRNNVKLNKQTIDDLIRAMIRVNYGQTTNVHLFLGSISVAGSVFGKMWSIYGGNKQVPESLVKESEANFLNNRVVKISFDEPNKEYVVESVSALTNKQLSKRYDVVVIANPITSDSKTPIEFANFDPPIRVAGRYQRTVSTLVTGILNASYYQWYKTKIPDLIINNENHVVSSISKMGLVLGKNNVQTPLWKIFSERPLTYDEFKAMFQKPKVIEMRDWLAYPKYEKLNVLNRNFKLHDRLFYINAIEWAASAMEMSVIGAKNVALLVEKELQSTGKV